MLRNLSLLTVIVAIASCASQPNYEAPVLCHRCKPQIAMIPLAVTAQNPYDWDLSQELTTDILDCVMESSRMWVNPLAQYSSAIELTQEMDKFGSDLSYANYFCQNDFLVIMELVKHNLSPYNKERFPHIDVRKAPELYSVMAMAVRLRVLDLRHEEPKIVMQELVETEQLLTNRAAKIDYSEISYTSPDFESTPLAQAHHMLARELSEKLECALLTHW